MSEANEKIKAQLALLRQKFVDNLPQRLADMRSAILGWSAGGPEDHLDDFYRAAHSLAGSGATFGFQGISDAARTLECSAKSLKENPARSDQVAAEMEALLAALGRAIEDDIVAGTGKEIELPDLRQELRQSGEKRRLIYLLEDEAEMRESLLLQLGHYGYQVEGFENAAALQAAVSKKLPSLIVADIVLPEGEQAGINVIKTIQAEREHHIPVVFISSSTDFDARLEVVRAGGAAYLPKPFTLEALVDLVDELSVVPEPQAYRVLVVDDSEVQARVNAILLEHAGMVTAVVTDPKAVLVAMLEFSPELVLMDMYMPHCSGVELAAVIRQQPAYVSVPIVFLSAETDRDAQLEAMRLGGDDFLTKPIAPSDLVGSVTIRAERYRTIRSLMSQDGLTGLLNHTLIIERLNYEVSRAKRHNGRLSYVMLDIAHFKQLNDTYGHAAGDALIKNLSRMLQQRLRNSDVIGRYGGEEFAVIMGETSLDDAVRVMDEIREQFSKVIQHAGEKTFQVTFSCGVATLPPITNPGELRETADARLYLAKNGGRNRVVGEG